MPESSSAELQNRPHYNPNARMKDEQGITRRNFMIGGAAALTTAAFGARTLLRPKDKEKQVATAQSKQKEFTPATKIVISPDLQNLLHEEGVTTVTTAFTDYVDAYGCPHPQIEFVSQELSGETQVFEGGAKKHFLEQAEAGKIHLDVDEIGKFARPDELQTQLRHTVLHSMTHACEPFEARPYHETLVIPDDKRSTVTGFQGFAALVKFADGTSALRKVEEGTAEALAVKMDGTYQALSHDYFQVGSLTIKLMNSFSSPQEVSRLIQSSDLLGFVRIVTGRPNPTPQDLLVVLTWYERAFQGQSLEIIQEEILNYRK